MMAPRRLGPVERLRVETERASAALHRAGGVGGTIADWLNGYAVALARISQTRKREGCFERDWCGGGGG